MTVYAVQACLNNLNGELGEYTHYVCREEQHAKRLAAILRERRPELEPISVEAFDMAPDRYARQRFADKSEGPRA